MFHVFILISPIRNNFFFTVKAKTSIFVKLRLLKINGKILVVFAVGSKIFATLFTPIHQIREKRISAHGTLPIERLRV